MSAINAKFRNFTTEGRSWEIVDTFTNRDVFSGFLAARGEPGDSTDVTLESPDDISGGAKYGFDGKFNTVSIIFNGDDILMNSPSGVEGHAGEVRELRRRLLDLSARFTALESHSVASGGTSPASSGSASYAEIAVNKLTLVGVNGQKRAVLVSDAHPDAEGEVLFAFYDHLGNNRITIQINGSINSANDATLTVSTVSEAPSHLTITGQSDREKARIYLQRCDSTDPVWDEKTY